MKNKVIEEEMREILNLLNIEIKKLKEIFPKLKLKSEGKETFNLASCHFQDALYFYDKKEYVKSFELANYVWEYLDALANLNLLTIPRKFLKHFKIEQK